jgi:formylglycine-generating enzyme required for sulfatase activity
MKLLSPKIVLLLSVFVSSAGFGQMIKAPTKPATAPVQKPTVKKVVQFKDDDDKVDTVTATKPVDNTFAYLVLKSNRGSAVTVTINDNKAGTVKAGMSKRLPMDNSDEMRISMTDGQGNLYDTSFVVGDADAKKTIVVAFPEIDYAAIRADEARKIKEAQAEELRRIKELQAEELRKQKEAEEALRLQRIGLLTETETSLRGLLVKTLTERETLQKGIDRVKKGETPITDEITGSYKEFITDRTQLADNLRVYSDSATAYNMKDRRDNFFKETKIDQDKALRDEFHSFIPNVLAGKVPMSADVTIAFKTSRVQDIPFFIGKDTLADANIDGKRIIYYALAAKSNAAVFKYLFENGVSANNFAIRFPDNKDIYATPITIASINGDVEVLKLFAEKQGLFVPNGTAKLEKKKQLKYINKQIGDKPNVWALLKEYKYDMDDGTAAMLAAMAYLDSSMVMVQGGQFTMGCSAQLEADCASDEKPAIKVTVDDFYISKFEVPQKVWTAIMDDENPSFFKDCPDCPVEMVSWKMADEFIKKVNKITGKQFRLPTEAEWEYAARGGKSEDPTFMYAGAKDIQEVAWYKDNSAKTSPIGSKKPNALGLYDMSGSVSEWCNDFYASDYFTRSTLINPKGPEVSSQKVTRGGSFMQSSWSSRVSNREGHEDFFTNNNTGFRLAMSK